MDHSLPGLSCAHQRLFPAHCLRSRGKLDYKRREGIRDAAAGTFDAAPACDSSRFIASRQGGAEMSRSAKINGGLPRRKGQYGLIFQYDGQGKTLDLSEEASVEQKRWKCVPLCALSVVEWAEVRPISDDGDEPGKSCFLGREA